MILSTEKVVVAKAASLRSLSKYRGNIIIITMDGFKETA